MDKLKVGDIVKVIGSYRTNERVLGIARVNVVPDEFGRGYYLIAIEVPELERGDGFQFHLSDGRRLELVFRA